MINKNIKIINHNKIKGKSYADQWESCPMNWNIKQTEFYVPKDTDEQRRETECIWSNIVTWTILSNQRILKGKSAYYPLMKCMSQISPLKNVIAHFCI